jgi:hypothetical protein
VVTLTSTGDTTIRPDQPTDNFGAFNRIWVGGSQHTSNRPRRALLEFNFSTIPVGATINSVTLDMTVTDTHNITSNFQLFRSRVDWGEGTKTGKGGGAATAGEASWTNRLTGTAAWGAAGGQSGVDYEAAASASLSLGTSTGRFTWSGAGLANDVRYWLANPTLNFGWFLISAGENTSQSVVRFATREDGTTANRPTLTVDYTPAAAPAVFSVVSGPTPSPLRVMKSGAATSAVGVKNTGTGAGDFTITSPTAVTVTPNGQTNVAVNATVNLAVGWSDVANTGARNGSFLVHNTNNAADQDDSVSLAGAVVDKRVVSGPTGTLNLGNVLAGGAVTVPITFTSTTGDDNSFTRVGLANQASNGLTLGGTAVTFDGTNGSNARTATFVGGSAGTVNATANFAVTPEGIGDAGYATVNVPYTAVVGNAAAKATPAGTSGKDATFDAASKLTASVTTSYAGLTSSVTSGGTAVGTAATLLAGGATSAGTISMNWRTRAEDEKRPGAMFSDGSAGGISDVLELLGGGSDVFVLQMSYDPNLLPGGAATEASNAAANALHIDRLINGVWGNAGLGTNQGPWTAYAAAHSITDMNAVIPSALVGAWGVDTSTDKAWVITNHNSQFMVVPEPGTLALLGAAAVGLLALMWRRRQ